MKLRMLVGAFAAAAWTVALAAPASAHGNHDAWPMARNLTAGPYIVSLWQVYPDTGVAMTPHLIVMFDGLSVAPPTAVIEVAVNSTSMGIGPSPTTRNGWETTEGIDVGDQVAVTISDGAQAWDLAPVVVPAPPTSMIPMDELLYTSIFLTFATTCWVARRTARAWRRPLVGTS